MKNKIKRLGNSDLLIIVLAVIIGVSFTACDELLGGLGDPELTGKVTITGKAEVGATLTATIELIDGGDVSYQWKRGSTDIGTNSNTYIVQDADIGSSITVTITVAGFSGSIVSSPTSVVTNPNAPALAGTVSINGTAVVGQTLTANTAAVIGNIGDFSYQWKRNDGTVIGANLRTYLLQTADVGSTITVTVTSTGNSGNLISAPTSSVTQPGQGNGNINAALNGSWFDEDGGEHIFNNGNLEILYGGIVIGKATYTTSGNNMTIIPTQARIMMATNSSIGDGGKSGESDLFGNNKAEFLAAMEKLYRELGFSEREIAERLAEDDLEADEILADIFTPLTGTFVISGNTLTTLFYGDTVILTRGSGSGNPIVCEHCKKTPCECINNPPLPSAARTLMVTGIDNDMYMLGHRGVVVIVCEPGTMFEDILSTDGAGIVAFAQQYPNDGYNSIDIVRQPSPVGSSRESYTATARLYKWDFSDAWNPTDRWEGSGHHVVYIAIMGEETAYVYSLNILFNAALITTTASALSFVGEFDLGEDEPVIVCGYCQVYPCKCNNDGGGPVIVCRDCNKVVPCGCNDDGGGPVITCRDCNRVPCECTVLPPTGAKTLVITGISDELLMLGSLGVEIVICEPGTTIYDLSNEGKGIVAFAGYYMENDNDSIDIVRLPSPTGFPQELYTATARLYKWTSEFDFLNRWEGSGTYSVFIILYGEEDAEMAINIYLVENVVINNAITTISAVDGIFVATIFPDAGDSGGDEEPIPPLPPVCEKCRQPFHECICWPGALTNWR
jgi:hypothetical protein